MVLPLDHSSLPVVPSSAHSMAGEPFCAPPEPVNTTPFTIMGVSAAGRLRDVQPGCKEGAPVPSTIFHAATEPLAAASSQRVPAGSCQVASAPTELPDGSVL